MVIAAFEALRHPPRSLGPLLRFVLERYGQGGSAGFGGVDEGRAFAVGGGGAEEEALLGTVGKSGEAGFSVRVGADFEVELAGVHESVGDVDFDGGGIDWGAGGIGDGEVGGAGADGSVDDGDGFGVDRGGVGEGCEKDGAEGERE